MPKVPAGVAVRDLSTSASAYALQRMAERFLGARFGPGTPLASTVPPQEQTNGPRQYQYPTGTNLILSPRREDNRLTPFEQLRNLAALYDVAALCIAVRIEELQGLPWSVVARDKRRQHELQEVCDEAAVFWRKPDQFNEFPAWLGMLLYDLFSIDAPTLYRRPDLGGRLYGLDIVDGATIKPLLDDRGRTVAYQQVLHGMAWGSYERDGAAERDDDQEPTWGLQELLYKPRWVRSFTPYGFPPTEWVILRVNTAIRKQSHDLAYFTDGNIPDMLAAPPDGMLDPTQVAAFEEWFNAALQGDDAARRKMRFLPWRADVKELRPFSYETKLDEWMLRVTCAAYGVPPNEMGFTMDVNKASAEMQEAVNERRGLRPLTTWLKSTIFDPTLPQLDPSRPGRSISRTGAPTRQAVSDFDLVEFQWHFGDTEDRLQQAQADNIYAGMGAISADEVRTLRFGDVLDGPAPAALATPDAAPAAPAGAEDDQELVLEQLDKAESDYSDKTQAKRKRYDEMRQNSPRHQQKRAARAAVRAAIERGDLAPPSERKCAHCDAKASQYNHKSYDRKGGLDVEPTCASCNTRLSHKQKRRPFEKVEREMADVDDGTREQRRQIERSAQKVFEQAYGEQAGRIKAVLLDHQADEPAAWQESTWYQELWAAEAGLVTQLVLPFYEDLAEAGTIAGADRIKLSTNWETEGGLVRQLARESAGAFASLMTETSRREIEAIIKQWLKDGGTREDLMRAIERVWTGPRPATAGVHETSKVFIEAQLASWERSGVVKAWKWSTAEDEMVCPICRGLNGTIYPINDRTAQIERRHVRCRCDVAPVVKSPKEII